MKKQLLLLIVFTTIFVHSYANDISVKPQTKEVLVYLQNAQINATAEVNIIPGTYNIVLENLSQYLDENSVQIKGDADFTILSVVTKKNYLGEQKKSPKLKEVEDSIVIVSEKIEALNNQIQVYDEEISMIKSNQSIGGANVGVTTAELEKMANFYRNRLLEVYKMRTEQLKTQSKLYETKTLLQNQLTELKNLQAKVYSEVVVSIKSNTTVKSKLNISYMVNNAGWSPFYDIKVENLNEPIVILSKANVFQNTGEDWKNVKLSLSTGNPNTSNTKPTLNPFTLSFANPNQLSKYKTINAPQSNIGGVYQMDDGSGLNVKGSRVDGSEIYIDGIRIKGSSNLSAEYTENIENQTNNIFDINIPYTIPTDGKEYVVSIQEYKVPAAYSYTAIPKLDKDAFLIANLINWDQTGLLPGEANLFNEGTFVGKSYFETRITNDTIPVSLGREKNIIIERKKVKNYTEKNFIGSTKKTTLEFEIVLRNKKKGEAEITIEDQIPLSSKEEVTIELINTSNAVYNKDSGKLEWKLKLKSSETVTLKFGYIIKYPRKYNIANL